jgi:hypothetical protein
MIPQRGVTKKLEKRMVGVSRYTLFLQSRCGYACGDRETSLFRHDQPLAGTTELLDSGRTWDLSVNEAKGSPVTRLRLRSSRWTSCHLNPSNGLLIQTIVRTAESEHISFNRSGEHQLQWTGHLQGVHSRDFLADTLIHLHPSKLKTDVLYEETVLHPAPCFQLCSW